MEVKDNGRELQKNLDMEFRRILRIIKPYIPCVMNNDYLTFYRLWLEKLNDTDPSEKQERNHYLIELCYQIQDGILEYPFTQLPAPGPLEPLRSNRQNSKAQIQEHLLLPDLAMVDRRPELPENAVEAKAVNCISRPPTIREAQEEPNIDYDNYSKQVSIMKQNALHNSDSVKVILKGPTASQPLRKSHKKRNQYTLSKDMRRQKGEQGALKSNVLGDCGLSYLDPPIDYHLQSDCAKGTNLKQFLPEHPCYMNSPQSMSPQVTFRRPPSQRANHNLINVGVTITNERADEESSWCDLSDASSTTNATKFGSGDSDPPPTPRVDHVALDKTYEIYENRIMELMNTVTDLQKQNVTLNEDVAKYERDLTLRNTKAETSLHNLAFEVNSLKTRLQELTEIKTALKNSHLVVATQWEATVHALNKELQVTQDNNAVLKGEIAALQKKLEDVTTQKQKDNAALRQKLNEMHGKEIEMLKQNHIRQVTDLENKYNQKLNELQHEYDSKILEITSEYKKVMKCKNMEIQRLELMINTQCKKMHEEVSKIRNQMEGHTSANNEESIEKVTFLQKCVAKMDKLFKKSEKHFTKQILKLKREIELRDKIIQIQLSTQRAELISNTNTDRQIEVDATVVQLEERYRKLLHEQQAHYLSEKKHDSRLISELRAVIAKNSADNY